MMTRIASYTSCRPVPASLRPQHRRAGACNAPSSAITARLRASSSTPFTEPALACKQASWQRVNKVKGPSIQHAEAASASQGSSAGPAWTESTLAFSKLATVAAAAVCMCAPHSLAALLHVSAGPSLHMNMRAAGALLLVPAMMCHALQAAVRKDLLKSATYQRIALSLVAGSLLVLLAGISATQRLPPRVLVLGILPAVLVPTCSATYQTAPDTSLQVALRSCAAGPLALCRLVLRSGQTWAAKAYAGLAVSLGLLGTLGLAPDLLAAPWGGMAGCSLTTLTCRILGVGLCQAAVAMYTIQDAVARDRQSASTFQELMLAVAASSLPFALIVMQSPAPYAAGIKALLAIVSGASGILALASLTILRQ